MHYLLRKQPDKHNPSLYSKIFIAFAYLVAFILKPSQCASSNPIFLTTLPNIEAGSWVLSTTTPTTSSGFSFQNTVVNYINAYTSIPNVGFGIDFINSVYTTSLTAQYLIDLSTVQRLQTYAMIQLNRTANSITQLSVNYIVSDSSFWLDIRQTLVDLSGTVAFTSASSLSRTVVTQIAYKTKSNSSNAQVTYNTIGIDMYRQNTHVFSFQITLAAKSLSSFNLSILVGGNNRIRTIRICSYSYEAIANSVDPPFYIDLGVVSSFSGTFPDSSALAISSYGTIYTGMVDWMIDDANSVLDYNMANTGLSYSLTTTSISQTKTAYFWYRKQSCPDYTFLNNHVCEPCHFSCLTCFSTAQTGCLSCPTTRTYVSTNRTCPCVTNYVNVNVTLCVQLTCQPTCLTCANLDQCGTCDTTLGRYLSGINCLCKDYTIDVYESMGQRLCYPCHMTCQTCSAAFSETACLTCNLSKDKRFFRASNSTCACVDKFYPPPSTMSPVCASCQYSCSKCLTGTTCTQCNSTRGRLMNATSQLCSCMSQFYDDLLNEQCVTCPYRCLTCNSQGCLTCNASLFRQISSRQCVCMKGYFDDNANGLCQKCDFTCSTCNSLVECSSCNSSLQRYMDVSTGKQLCLCAPRYYSVTGIEQCMFCWSTCVTCNGPNENNCLSCDTTKYRQLSVDKKCVCKAGYFQVMPNIQLCSVCNYTCETCDNSASCLTCSAVNFRFKNAANQCQCMTGYYDNGNQLCLRCDYRCLTCSSSATCLTCDSATRNTTSLSNCVCLSGFWDDGISTSCKPCLAECLTCTDGNGCTSCPTNKVLTTTKNCVCMAKTYPPNCIGCNYNCQECVNTAIQCTKCNGTAMRYLNPTTKSCVCYDGYFDDGINELCSGCHYSCLTCTSFASCLTCPPNRVKVGALCSCINQFYESTLNKNCLACHYSCKTCQAFAQCTSCDATKFRTFPLSGPSNLTVCTCAAGYYDDWITELCYKCDAKCLTCSAFSTCLTCDSALNRYFVFANNNCLCLDGYFQDTTTFLCVRCDVSCQTCSSSTSCLTCPTGRSIPTGGGLCLCLSGTFDHPTTRTCTTCSYPCLTCSSASTTCTSCDGTRNLLASPVSQCQCKIGTFENGTACDSCLSTCSSCTNKTACTVCRPGTNRNLDGSNLCPCVSGFHDEGSTLLTCLRCHYSCVTCASALSCLSCFTGRLPVANSTCACPAQRFYDDGVNGACVPCAYNCLTCVGLPTNCTSCSSLSYRDLTSNNCVCRIGYFENNVETCVKCHYSCRSCSSLSSCLTCDSTLKRVSLTGPFCSCQAGFFDDGINAQCQPCDYTCKECTGVATQCTSCPLTRTFDSVNKKCPCTIGLFDSGSATCVSCLYSCNECVNAYECTSCPTTTRNLQASTKQCLCNNGLYNVNLQQNCLPCDPLCLTCTDYSNCLTCDTSNNFRYVLNAACVCPNGYYDNWIASANTDLVCRKCHYSCENCVSLTQCTSCSLLGERLYNVSSKLCSCKPGFYDQPSNMPCIKCPSDCLTCLDANTCLTCSAQRTLNSVSLRCDCAASFYANGTTCELCPAQCSTCANLSHCTACNGQRILTNNQCICAVGSFMVPNTALCTGCQYSCESCVSSLMCSTCNATNKRFLSGSFCRCMIGFYDDNVTQPCVACHYSCRSCVEDAKCLSCDLTANRVLNLATNLCQCLTGFYEDPTSKLCIRCHYTCVTCATGTTCSTCNNLHYRILNTSNSQCECPAIDYFDDNTQSMCQTCDFKCLSCRTLATTCTSCLTSANRFLQVDKCTCLNGYFDNGALTCSKCSYKCLTCEGVADNCTSCSTVALRTTHPTCACQVGFFDDGVNSLCKPCDYRCQSCSNPFTCDSCDATKHRTLNPTTKMCDCMPVYYDQLNTSNCIPCTFSCVTCAHPTLCLTCPSTRTYKNGICECNIKRYEDFSSLECPACDYSCKTCTNATECSSCSVLMSRVFNSSSRKCSCVQGFYDTGLQEELCLKCEKSCFTCTNFTHCLTCPSNVNKTINTTISTLCTCLYGYYEDINAGIAIGQSSVCYACHYSCEKCSGQSYACTECQAAKHRYLNTEKQCVCEQFYFDDGRNELCIKCTTNCLACWGEGASQCLTCDNSTYILNNQCYTTCPNYYRNFITTSSIKTCKLCTPFCLKCSSSQIICEQCQLTHRLFKYNQTHTLCIDHCPQFYYEQPVTKECLECKAPCYHCSNKYVCTDCLSGYYLDTYCYKCHPYCFSCSGPTVFDCITCVNGYYLDNGLCRKLTCGQFQYVHSLNGCVNCTTTYPNSLTCDSQVIKSCKDNYKLQTTKLSNGLTSSVCRTCSQVAGYKMNILQSGEIQCVQICGDGIIINDQCDDGNTLNGDGCSEFCKIEKDWTCVNKTKCDLKTKPQMRVVRTVKIDKINRIQVYLELTIGLRLVKENFVLGFSESSVKFDYSIEQLDSKYTQYKLIIDYQTTIQHVKLAIKVVSPVSQLTSSKISLQQSQQTEEISPNSDQRSLQQLELAIPLQIQLAIELEVDIITEPPATYINTQTRTVFSYIVYVFLAYQILCILLTFWLVYKRIKFMLIVIDLITSMRIVYVLATFGMYNISELLPMVSKGLQPFVYQFGPAVQDIYSAFYSAGYTRLIFSSCCIQVGILLICLAIKYLSEDKKTQNEGHYYLNAFIYCCSIDIYLSCISIICSTEFSTYIGSYSWAFAILILMGLTMHNIMYIAQGKSAIYKNRTILPTKSFATGDLDMTKEKQLNNQVLDTSEFHSSHNEGYQEESGDGQVWSEHHTEVVKSQKAESVKEKEPKSKQVTQTKESLLSLISINTGHQFDLYDLAPSVEYSISKAKTFYESSVFYESGSRNKLTLYHLPILNNLLPLVLVLIATLVKSGSNYLVIRSSLLLGLFFFALVFMLLEKPETIKSSARNIKLIFNYCVYLSICIILVLATVTKSQNINQWIDLSILSIIVLFFVGSITFWFINLKYSPQYKEYLIELRNQQIIERNKLAQEPRKKIYTGVDDKSFNTSPIKNIFRKQPEKYIPQSLQSHSISQANSVNQQNQYYNRKSKNVENVFEQQNQEAQSPTQQHHYNQRIHFIQPTNDKQPTKQTKIKAINEYDAYLSSYGTFAAVKQPKQSQTIVIKNPNPSQLKSKLQQTHEQVRISSNFSESNSNVFNKKSQGNDAIKRSIKLDNQSFIQKNKRVSPRKISTLAKVQRKDDNLNHNSLILDNDLTVVVQEPNRKISKRIDGNNDQKLLALIKDQQQKSQLSQKHYMYRNPPSQSALSKSKSKSKSKGKSTGSLHSNKSLPKKLKTINNVTAHLDEKILMLQQSNNPRNHLTEVSDFVDNETNQPNESRSKQESKITDYSLLMNKAHLKKQMIESDQSLQVQRQRTGEVKSSFSQQYHELNKQVLKHANDGISSGLSDDLSDEDYELEFPTGINSRARNERKKSEVQDESMMQKNRPRKFKKSQPEQRGLESKKQSREKRPSISPSKLSVYQRPHLEDISSIHEQGQEVFSEVSQLGIEDDLNVYNKILKDHQKYKDKKVDKKFIEKELRRKDHNDSLDQDERE